jgi:hypothetical protein
LLPCCRGERKGKALFNWTPARNAPATFMLTLDDPTIEFFHVSAMRVLMALCRVSALLTSLLTMNF